jgi:hypothetical protein
VRRWSPRSSRSVERARQHRNRARDRRNRGGIRPGLRARPAEARPRAARPEQDGAYECLTIPPATRGLRKTRRSSPSRGSASRRSPSSSGSRRCAASCSSCWTPRGSSSVRPTTSSCRGRPVSARRRSR